MEKSRVIENLKYAEKYMGMPEQGSTWSPNAQTKAIEEAINTLEKIPQIISNLAMLIFFQHKILEYKQHRFLRRCLNNILNQK